MVDLNESKYLVRLYFIVLSVDKKTGKRYVLSTNESDITFPNMLLNNDMINDLSKNIIQYVQTYVFTNELELIPQLINLHCVTMEKINGELNTIYGFIIDKTEQINNSYWIEFSYGEPAKNSLAIFETIQNLR